MATPAPNANAIRLPNPGQLVGQDPAAYHSRGGIQTLDYLRAKLDPKGFEAFLVGKIHQKVHRGFTRNGQPSRDDYMKAAVYLRYLLQHSGTQTADRSDGTEDLADRLGPAFRIDDAADPGLQLQPQRNRPQTPPERRDRQGYYGGGQQQTPQPAAAGLATPRGGV